METQPKKPTAGPGKDRISELPDEILYHILGRSEHPGQTIVLSKEWRRVWRSYPVVDFNERGSEHLQKFGDSTIDRFSRDNLLPMESLKLKLSRCERLSPSVVEQLIDLALERKSKAIEVLSAFSLDKSLPYRVLFNSTVESLRLSDVFFALDKYVNIPLSPTRLRSLYLYRVQFKDVQLLTNLISNSPLLENLELIAIAYKISKLQLSKVPNLKMLRLRGACSLEQLEIVAPQLQSLYLRDTGLNRGFKIELTAPQLNLLEIVTIRLPGRDLAAMISKLPSLKYLTLDRCFPVEKKLTFSCPSLVEFKLYTLPGLEEFEFDAGPRLETFLIWYVGYSNLTHELKKCEIKNAGPSIRSEVYYSIQPFPQ